MADRRIDHHSSVEAYAASEEIAAGYDAFFGFYEPFLIDQAWVLNRLPAGSRVLDVGCGTGRHVVLLADAGHDLSGTDLNPHMLTQTRRKLQRYGLHADLRHGDAVRLPFDSARFDAVLLMGSLLGLLRGYWLRRAALTEARRVLRPGGSVFLHVYGRHGHWRNGAPGRRLWLRMNLLAWRHGLAPGDRIMPGYRNLMDLYLHAFTRQELQRLLQDSGFVTREICGLSSGDSPDLLTGRFDQRDAQAFLIQATT